MKRLSAAAQVTLTIWFAAAPSVRAVQVIPSLDVATAAAPPTPPTTHHKLPLCTTAPNWLPRAMFEVRKVQVTPSADVWMFCPDAPFISTTESVPPVFVAT